jgi:class 3 adenylate cyclase/tetratricopeptide (TPR) repeat protein
MAGTLDPEVWTDIMNAAFEILSEPVDRFGGMLARLMGDAILAFFGAPIAHEDDPQRAVSAGLAILDGVQPLRQKLLRERGLDFNVRVGINTGLVVMSEVGSEVREEYTAMGDAVNLAARMEQTAEPGTIQITESTYKLIAPYFDIHSIGGVVVKGKSEPVAAYRVLGEASEPGPARGLEVHGIQSPLVGRGVELATGKDAIARLQEGRGSILLIFGEAGIGKSRLLSELRQTSVGAVREPPLQSKPTVQWLEGRAQPFGQTISFWPFLEILREFAAITKEDNDKETWLKLEKAVGNLFPAKMAEVLPYLASALNLEVSETYAERVRYLDGEAMGDQINLAFRSLFEALSRKRPLLLVFEDLHWVDASSARLLERMLPLVEVSPLLICGLSRPDPGSPAIRLAEAAVKDYHPYFTEMRLVPLSPADSNEFVNNLLEIDDLPPRMHDMIVRKADGNPYFLEEIIRNLIEANAVVRNPSTGHWQATAQVGAIAIPDTIQGVIMARVDRLDETVKEVLRTAAVVGRIFLYRILKTVLKDEKRLDQHLADLTSVELIQERQSMPELEYIFKHALARDATYESILLQKRRSLHAKVGQAIESLFVDRLEEFYGLLAYHYTSAGAWEKAQYYLFRVGDQAEGMAADDEALAHYRQATAAYEQAFDERMAPLQRASVARKMGVAYFRLGRNDESQALLSSAVALVDRSIPATRQGLAIRLAGQTLLQAIHRLWPKRFLGKSPEHKKLAIWEALLAYERLSTLSFINGDSFGLQYMSVRSLNLAEAAGSPQEMTRGYANAALGAGSIGQSKLADYYIRLAQEENRRHDDASVHAFFLMMLGFTSVFVGRWDQALNALVGAGDIYQRIGFDRDREVVLNASWIVFKMTGPIDDKLENEREILASAERRGDRQMILWTLLLMAETRLRLGGPGHEEQVINLLDRSEKVQAENPNPFEEILIQGLKGQVRYRQGNLEAAYQATESAVGIYRSEQMLLNFYYSDSYASLPFVALSLWEAAMMGSFKVTADSDGKELARNALKIFRGFAWSYSFARSRASLYQGTYDWLSGKYRQAQKNWEKSLALAEDLEMPYEQALAHYEIGRHLNDGDPGRKQHLEQAADIFSQLDAAWNLKRVREAM